MYVLTAQHGFDWSECPSYRVIAIFKDKLTAMREKRKIEKAIESAYEKGESNDQLKYMEFNENHPNWRYVIQLDSGFDPSMDDTTYHIQQSRVLSVL